MTGRKSWSEIEHRAGRTEVISVHSFRRVARRRERLIQAALTEMIEGGVSIQATGGYFQLSSRGAGRVSLPIWTRGVRTRKAGAFSHEVEATSWRGH